MNDMYVIKGGMTNEQMFRLRLINGFNFAPIIADAIVDLSKDFFQNENSGVCNGQILYLAVSDEEGPGKSILDSKHVEVILYTRHVINDLAYSIFSSRKFFWKSRAFERGKSP